MVYMNVKIKLEDILIILKKYNNHLMFSTEACYFKSQEFKKIKQSTTALQELETSSLKTIDTSDKNRY